MPTRRRRSRIKYPKSSFSMVNKRQWRHNWASGLVGNTGSAGIVSGVVEFEAPSNAEVALLKDLAIHVSLRPATSDVAGRFYWYRIPKTTTITTTAIDKNDTRRIWNPIPVYVVNQSGANLLQYRTFRFPKIELNEGDKFGLAFQRDYSPSTSATLNIGWAAKWLEASYGGSDAVELSVSGSSQ